MRISNLFRSRLFIAVTTLILGILLGNGTLNLPTKGSKLSLKRNPILPRTGKVNYANQMNGVATVHFLNSNGSIYSDAIINWKNGVYTDNHPTHDEHILSLGPGNVELADNDPITKTEYTLTADNPRIPSLKIVVWEKD